MQKTTGRVMLSRYRLTEVECKLVYHLIKHIEGAAAAYRYDVMKLLQIAKLPESHKQSLLQIMAELFHKSIHMNKPSGWVKYHWFDCIEYNIADNVLVLRFDEELKPHLQSLRKKHTFSDFQKMNACGVFPWTDAGGGLGGA